MVEERRRSERIWLTIPVRVSGKDAAGRLFEESGRARTLSRHGARIQVSRPLERFQTVRLESPLGHFASEFKVVSCEANHQSESPEYGLECLDNEINFWGIEFPSVAESLMAEAKGLLECRICHKLGLLALTLSEVEALRGIGIVGKYCRHCTAITPWRYAEVRIPLNRSAEVMGIRSEHVQPSLLAAAAQPPERGHRRAYMQLPVGIRDSQGKTDTTRTENVSRCGFCFRSEKTYMPGEIVLVSWPFESLEHHMDLAARIVREEDIEGTEQKLYGATFEPRNCAAAA